MWTKEKRAKLAQYRYKYATGKITFARFHELLVPLYHKD